MRGRWKGIDEKAKGVQVHWPGRRTVSIECNVYVDRVVPAIFMINYRQMPAQFCVHCPESYDMRFLRQLE